MAELTDYEVLHHITGVFISTGTAYFQEIHCYKFEVKPDPYFARFTRIHTRVLTRKKEKKRVCAVLRSKHICGFSDHFCFRKGGGGGGGRGGLPLWLDPCHTYTINTHTDIKTNHITPARLRAVGVTRLIAIRKQNHSSFAFPTLTSTAAASTRELSATIPTSHTHFNSCSIHQRTQHHHTNLHIT